MLNCLKVCVCYLLTYYCVVVFGNRIRRISDWQRSIRFALMTIDRCCFLCFRNHVYILQLSNISRVRILLCYFFTWSFYYVNVMTANLIRRPVYLL